MHHLELSEGFPFVHLLKDEQILQRSACSDLLIKFPDSFCKKPPPPQILDFNHPEPTLLENPNPVTALFRANLHHPPHCSLSIHYLSL
jgi:hypothetical protein